MLIKEIREIAAKHGIKPGKMTKGELVRAIQRNEGNFDCFESPINGECDQMMCVWRSDCLGSKEAAPVKKKATTKKKASAKKSVTKKASKKKAAAKKK